MCRSEASDPLMHPPKEAMPRNSRLRRRQLLLRTLLLPLHLLPRQLQSPMQREESLGCASAESGPGKQACEVLRCKFACHLAITNSRSFTVSVVTKMRCTQVLAAEFVGCGVLCF